MSIKVIPSKIPITIASHGKPGTALVPPAPPAAPLRFTEVELTVTGDVTSVVVTDTPVESKVEVLVLVAV